MLILTTKPFGEIYYFGKYKHIFDVILGNPLPNGLAFCSWNTWPSWGRAYHFFPPASYIVAFPCCHETLVVTTPLWVKCEDETHTPKSGSLESFETPKNSELDFRGQNNSHWGVLYTIGKVLKCMCPKWPRMSHLDICSSRYGQKKGRESNWQFDSRPLKVRNRLDPDVCRRSATWRWKALKESYKIASDLIPIRGLSKKLWMPKVPGVQTRTISGLLLESPGKKCHSDVASTESCKEYYKGEGGGFPRVRAVVNQVSPRLPVACPNTKKNAEWVLTNLLVDFGCKTELPNNLSLFLV